MSEDDHVERIELSLKYLELIVYGNISIGGEVSNGSLVPQKNPALLIGRPQLAGSIPVFVVIIVGEVASWKFVHASFTIENIVQIFKR